ncbi:Uncharacterized protein Rs2_30633 [Raphanus sativus]|nr:Uncharacterized protein Rs2_30633 [Raphanus sativus]
MAALSELCSRLSSVGDSAEAITAPPPPALVTGRRKFLQLLCRRLLFSESEGPHGLALPAFSLKFDVWERLCSPVMVVVRVSLLLGLKSFIGRGDLDSSIESPCVQRSEALRVMSSDEARFGGRAPVTFRNGVGQVEAVALIFVLTMQMHPRVQPHAPLTRFPILVDQVQRAAEEEEEDDEAAEEEEEERSELLASLWGRRQQPSIRKLARDSTA